MKITRFQTLALFSAWVLFSFILPDGLSGAEKAQNQPSGSAIKAKESNEEPERIVEGDKGGVVEARVDRILKAVGNSLKTANEFSFHAEIVFENLESNGQKIQYSGITKVAVRRPDRFHVDYQGDLEARRVWYNGKTVTLLRLA